MVATARKCRGARGVLNRVLLLTATALGLIALATPARAEERMLTLAMVNFESLLGPRMPMFKDRLPSLAPRSQDAPAGRAATDEKPAFEESLSFTATLSIADAAEPDAGRSIVLLRQDSRGKNLLKLLDRFGAGYGQLFYDQTAEIYGRNGTGWEEPGYGYLKVSFRF